MRLEELICHYAQPQARIRRDQLANEVTDAYEGHLKAESEKYRCDPKALDKVLGGASHFIAIAESCFDYAVEGQLKTTGIGLQDDDWLDFASFIDQARSDAEFHSANAPALGLEHLFKLGAIRARLDSDTLGDVATDALPTVLNGSGCGYLTLNEVAFLALMTEKAVRNATQPTTPDRLHARKEGSRTVVDSHEALRWLQGRRNFTPTVLV
ncbi:hypothetical protein [Pseudomonas sp. RL]|uniref:hypothetical protein n=1 Tax=Pseudomonas sp. RL TaxID=1452718 RepID=UPI00068E542A|nr:hypothetical protein [Pseudomonas sp. RL]